MTDSKVNDGRVKLRSRISDRFSTLEIKRSFRVDMRKTIPHRSVGKSCACSARDPGSVPESGRSPGEGNGNPLQYPCLENPMDRGA